LPCQQVAEQKHSSDAAKLCVLKVAKAECSSKAKEMVENEKAKLVCSIT